MDTSGVFLLDGLNKLREHGTFFDVTLRVGDKLIRAHKNVICACSSYLDNVLGSLGESDEIVINDIDDHYLELLVEYMYTGTLNFDSTNVKDVLLTASLLKISSAEEICCMFLINNLVVDNCIEYVLFAGKHSIKILLKSSLKIAALHFDYIFSRSDYLEMEFEEFQRLTVMVKANGHSDDLIFLFVMRWINYSHEARKEYMNRVLNHTLFAFISPEVINSLRIVNRSEPVFTSWATQHAEYCNRRNPTAPSYRILVSRRLGNFSPLMINLSLEDVIHKIESVPYKINDGTCVSYGYYIYHQGGWKGNKELVANSYVYHQCNEVWVPFVPLQQARAYHSSCVLNGKIYSFGGSDGLKALSSAELVDLYTGQRQLINSLPRAKERAGLGIHGNSIYVVGGSDRGASYKCMHRFDEREGLWQELAPSPYRAGASSCAVVRENIYTTHPDALQRYDIRANDWTLIFGQYKRYPQEVYCVDETLYGLFNSEIAEYLPDRGKWLNKRALKFSLPHLKVSTQLCYFPPHMDLDFDVDAFNDLLENI